jgi:hypothetical protein
MIVRYIALRSVPGWAGLVGRGVVLVLGPSGCPSAATQRAALIEGSRLALLMTSPVEHGRPTVRGHRQTVGVEGRERHG